MGGGYKKTPKVSKKCLSLVVCVLNLELLSSSTHAPLRHSRSIGLAAASYEINDDPVFQDYNTGLGFAYALALTIRLWKRVPRQNYCLDSLIYLLKKVFSFKPNMLEHSRVLKLSAVHCIWLRPV